MPDVVAGWVGHIGPAFGISEAQWAGLSEDIEVALRRWVRHIEDPEDIDTYIYLRNHARRGFISQVPRLALPQRPDEDVPLDGGRHPPALRRRQPRRRELLALLGQEFQERILHITDFFVEAREEELREQEASYRQSIDNAPGGDLQDRQRDRRHPRCQQRRRAESSGTLATSSAA